MSTRIPKGTRTAADKCTALLRHEILSGVYNDGRPFIIDQIAVRLGVSHTPIREAVRRLEAEGFLSYEPQRGARIRPLSALEFNELVAIREALEPIALQQAIVQAENGRNASSLEDDFRSWSQATGSAEMLKAQWVFLRSMYSMSGLVRTLEAIDTNWRLIERFHHYSWHTSESVRREDYQLKERLLDRFLARDVGGALAAFDDCLQWGASLVRARLASLEPMHRAEPERAALPLPEG